MTDDDDPGIRGGGQELSRELTARTKEEPLRFLEMAVSKVPDDISPIYFGAILEGARARYEDASLEHPPGLYDGMLRAISRIARLPGNPAARQICMCLRTLASTPLPGPLLDLVSEIARNDPDPDREVWKIQAPSGGYYLGGDARSAGLNSNRGGAAGAIRQLLFEDLGRWPALRSAVESLVADRSTAVRTMAAGCLLPVLKIDRDEAVRLFLRLVPGHEVILPTRDAAQFLYWARMTHHDELRPLLLQMLTSGNAKTVELAGQQICLAALVDGTPERAEDAARARCGTVAARKGAAEVYARNSSNPDIGDDCRAHLPAFFHDDSEEVRDTAAACFRQREPGSLAASTLLIQAFLESPACTIKNVGPLIDHLGESLEQLPEVVFRLVEVVLPLVKSDPAGAWAVHELPKLVMRLYTQSPSEQLRIRCLDLIDAMDRLDLSGLLEQLQSHDRDASIAPR